MVLLAGIVTLLSWMSPVPEAVKPEAPPVCVAVNVSPVSSVGKVSIAPIPLTSLGPGLLTVMV